MADPAGRDSLDLIDGPPADTVGPRFAGVRLVDLGAGAGDSLVRAESTLDVSGIGFDRNPRKVERARRRGHEVHRADIRRLDPADFPDCWYVWLDNTLEHLRDLRQVARVLDVATAIADRLVVITHPSFEDVDRLAEHGLKLYWNDWTGHTAPARVSELIDHLHRRGHYRIMVRPSGRIRGSEDPKVLPLDAPPDQVRPDPSVPSVYREDAHGPKPPVTFDWPVYTRFEILVQTGDGRVHAPAESGAAIEWSDLPGQAPSTWIRHFRTHAGRDPRLVNLPDGRTVLVEDGHRRAIGSPLVVRALRGRFGTDDEVDPAPIDALPAGPPVEPLKVPGRTPFLVAGGARHDLPRLPATHQVDEMSLDGLPDGGPLDVMAGNDEAVHARPTGRRGRSSRRR